ncbi:MAG: radical SAM protein, partial [Candidatus Heimdallarchaeaceae archaeon]
MELLGKYGKEDLAILYIAKHDGKIVEFVESLQPPIPREKKWVLIISTMYGCPVGCLMCDAGEYYHGKVSTEGMLEEIDFMIKNRFPDGKIPINKFKIQFARMGEPTLNEDVLEVINVLPQKYEAAGLMPCISTVAPNGSEKFLDDLIDIKNDLYTNGNFQLQFSIHSSDEEERQKWMTKNIWSLEKIAEYGERWFKEGDRKITLNFAV